MAVLKRKRIVRLHDTDAAGLLFFAQQFFYVHDIYEDLLRAIGLPMENIIAEADYFLPIVHAESQYHQSLSVGHELEVSVTVEKLGTTSYTLGYLFENALGEIVGRARTVHVSIERNSREKIPLPQGLRSRLEAFQQAP